MAQIERVVITCLSIIRCCPRQQVDLLTNRLGFFPTGQPIGQQLELGDPLAKWVNQSANSSVLSTHPSRKNDP